MLPKGAQDAHSRSLSSLSRRDLFRSTAAAAAAAAVPLAADDEDRNGDDQGKGASATTFAYVGTYTPNGLGIHIFQKEASGVLMPIKTVSTPSPSWLAFDPQKKFLFAANEISNFSGGTGSVSAFSVNKSNGDLTFLNTVSSQGAGPAHLSVDPTGKWVLVANYGGGNVAVLPILSNGVLANATDIKADSSACSPACAIGPTKAANAPPGSFAISGHDAPHAHMIQTDPQGNFAIVNDLGLDLTIVWKFNKLAGTLSNPQTFPSSPGAGPRHFAFHPNGRIFYSLNEEASTLAIMTYEPTTGALHLLDEVTTLPPGFKGTNFTSEVIVSRNGRNLYALNRLHNSIAIFRLGAGGEVERVGDVWTRADYPRSCSLEPTGSFLYVCHNRSDNVTTFRVDDDGGLTFTNMYTAVGSPSVIVFL